MRYTSDDDLIGQDGQLRARCRPINGRVVRSYYGSPVMGKNIFKKLVGAIKGAKSKKSYSLTSPQGTVGIGPEGLDIQKAAAAPTPGTPGSGSPDILGMVKQYWYVPVGAGLLFLLMKRK